MALFLDSCWPLTKLLLLSSNAMRINVLSCLKGDTANTNLTLTRPPEHCYMLLNSLDAPPRAHAQWERKTPTSLKITIDAPTVPLDYTTRPIDSADPTFGAILEVSPMFLTLEDFGFITALGKQFDLEKKRRNANNHHVVYKLYRMNTICCTIHYVSSIVYMIIVCILNLISWHLDMWL